MYYVYVLFSNKDRKLYIGSTGDLRRRMKEHETGQVLSTKNRRPLILVCYEAYRSTRETRKRELFLKSSDGHKDIKKRIVLI